MARAERPRRCPVPGPIGLDEDHRLDGAGVAAATRTAEISPAGQGCHGGRCGGGGIPCRRSAGPRANTTDRCGSEEMVTRDLLPRRRDISPSFSRTARIRALTTFVADAPRCHLARVRRGNSYTPRVPVPFRHLGGIRRSDVPCALAAPFDGGRRPARDSWYRCGSSRRLDCRCSVVQSVSVREVIAHVTRRTMIDSGSATKATRVDREFRRNSEYRGRPVVTKPAGGRDGRGERDLPPVTGDRAREWTRRGRPAHIGRMDASPRPGAAYRLVMRAVARPSWRFHAR